MDKNFDELFNDFFKSNNNNNNNNNNNSSKSDRFRNDILKLMDMLNSFGPNQNLEHELNDMLGEPDRVDTFYDGDIRYERSVWHTESGDIVRIIGHETSSEPNVKTPEKTLEEQLEEAITSENYEEAARIRDLINPPKQKPKRKTKKTDKNLEM
jgi:hypothetical protein